MSKKALKLDTINEKLYVIDMEATFSLLNCILFLTQDIAKDDLGEKSIALLGEIKDLLQSDGGTRETDPRLQTINYNDKVYYLFDKKIRINFSRQARLFDYKNYIEDTYRKKRILYLNYKNELISLVEQIKTKPTPGVCQLAKIRVQKQEKVKNENFLNNLLGDIYKDFYLPLNFISKILQLNIILIDREGKKVKDIVEHNNKYKYLLLTEKNNKYQAIVSEDRKVFTIKDDLVQDLKKLLSTSVEEIITQKSESKGLDKIMQEIENQGQNIKNYVANLGLEEA